MREEGGRHIWGGKHTGRLVCKGKDLRDRPDEPETPPTNCRVLSLGQGARNGGGQREVVITIRTT